MSKAEIKRYLAKIGSKGGKMSKRKLTPEQARAMVAAKANKSKKESK